MSVTLLNERAMPGANNPPSPIEYISLAMFDLGKFLTDNPVVETAEQAKEGALFVERSRKALQDLDDARRAEVDPLNRQVKVINEQYRAVRDPMDRVLSELKFRLTDFAGREEARRLREAEIAKQAALDAEIEARRAEEVERNAKANATFGEVTDVAAAVVDADQAFSTFAKADRAANIAERDVPVRLASQLGGRALSMRTKETLVLDSYSKALKAIGPNDKIRDAILSAARDYRKLKGHLPEGVSAITERSI